MLFIKLLCEKCSRNTYHHLRPTGVHEDGNDKIEMEILCIEHNDRKLVGFWRYYDKKTFLIAEIRQKEIKEISRTLWKP